MGISEKQQTFSRTGPSVQVFTLTESETLLPDDYPIVPMYVYIVDGFFTRAQIACTVGEWKRGGNKKEIRRCDLFAHKGAKLGDKVTAGA